jgi:hypothetical protein
VEAKLAFNVFPGDVLITVLNVPDTIPAYIPAISDPGTAESDKVHTDPPVKFTAQIEIVIGTVEVLVIVKNPAEVAGVALAAKGAVSVVLVIIEEVKA